MGRMLRLRHGEAFDVVAAAREHAGDAGEDARLIVDRDRKRVARDRLRLGSRRVMAGARRFHGARRLLGVEGQAARAKSTAAWAWITAVARAGSAISACV